MDMLFEMAVKVEGAGDWLRETRLAKWLSPSERAHRQFERAIDAVAAGTASSRISGAAQFAGDRPGAAKFMYDLLLSRMNSFGAEEGEISREISSAALERR